MRPPTSPGEAVTVLLERFSTKQLRQWLTASARSDAYYVKVFYELEAQRHAVRPHIIASLQQVNAAEVTIDGWARIVDFKYALDPLSTRGSIAGVGGRFNYGRDIDTMRFSPFNALYVAGNEETAHQEKFVLKSGDLVDGLAPHELALRKDNYTVLQLKGKATNIFDLTNRKNVAPFLRVISRFKIAKDTNLLAFLAKLRPFNVIRDTNALYRSLYDPWWQGWPRQHSIPANSQEFGRLIFEAGFDGILYDSTKGAGRCLVVFPQQLAGSETHIELAGTAPPECRVTRLDSSTWESLL